ncbi:UNVERIFIED_CONTAM: Elovl4 [Trichonephila clavipes]
MAKVCRDPRVLFRRRMCFRNLIGKKYLYELKVKSTRGVLEAISIPFWHYYLLKYLDLLDTVFFVLRKKYNQITLLHVVHHAGFCLILNAALPHVHKAVAYYPLPAFTINAAIHVIMYTYYGLTAFGPSMQKYLWWKKYLTVLQIVRLSSFIFIYTYTFQLTYRI